MSQKLNILAINGSASKRSTNLSILKNIAKIGTFELEIIENLYEFPSFRTELTDENVPKPIQQLREKIALADGLIFCTPEYIFSIPSGLKNILEWCVSTTVFSNKPTAIITASASGEQGHQELKLILETLQCVLTPETSLLIQGVKGKLNREGAILATPLQKELEELVQSFEQLVKKHMAISIKLDTE